VIWREELDVSQCGVTSGESAALAFVNARVVLPEQIVNGALILRDGQIEKITGDAPRGMRHIDLGNDLLLPGLVEVHTDNLERHLHPRPGAEWDPQSAVFGHDVELAGAGITTAFNAVSVGDYGASRDCKTQPGRLLRALATLYESGLSRVDQRVHLRCELSDPAVTTQLAEVCDHPSVGLVSLMDHTPGERQWRDLDVFREHFRSKYGLGPAQLETLIETKRTQHALYSNRNWREALALCRSKHFIIASHDDTTVEQVDVAAAAGGHLSEFPTTAAAAQRARATGLKIIMGAPNLLRGGSHVGNVSTGELAAAGLVDILSSDYLPMSLLRAAFEIPVVTSLPLWSAIRMVSQTPAEALGLWDRGAILPGRRADLVRVRETAHGPIVMATWRQGLRMI
jgi:alpha-D-ribose 1-methylphosphonate 5-triphosphate diphosphatase